MSRYCLALIFLLVILPAWVWAEDVRRVIDGDTFELTDTTKIRLYGMDCPEGGQAYGYEATDFVRELVQKQAVGIEIVSKDRYGRSVALVFLPDGSSVQAALLEAGLAWVAPRYCKKPICQDWQQKEDAARTAGRGLWQEPSPVPPWEWRKRTK